MSSYLAFYKLEKVKEKIPVIINTEDLDYDYIKVDRAPEYIKKIGLLRKVYYYHIDFFEAGRDLFGKTPDSVRVLGHFNGSYDLMYGADYKTVYKEQLDKYIKKIEFDAYVYNKIKIVEIRSTYMLDLKDFDMENFTKKDLLTLVGQCINEEDIKEGMGSSSYKDAVYGLMYLYFYKSNIRNAKIIAEWI